MWQVPGARAVNTTVKWDVLPLGYKPTLAQALFDGPAARAIWMDVVHLQYAPTKDRQTIDVNKLLHNNYSVMPPTFVGPAY